jgi:hypothetical protein
MDGEREAMVRVGHMLLSGYGVKQDPAEAARWMRAAWCGGGAGGAFCGWRLRAGEGGRRGVGGACCMRGSCGEGFSWASIGSLKPPQRCACPPHLCSGLPPAMQSLATGNSHVARAPLMGPWRGQAKPRAPPPLRAPPRRAIQNFREPAAVEMMDPSESAVPAVNARGRGGAGQQQQEEQREGRRRRPQRRRRLGPDRGGGDSSGGGGGGSGGGSSGLPEPPSVRDLYSSLGYAGPAAPSAKRAARAARAAPGAAAALAGPAGANKLASGARRASPEHPLERAAGGTPPRFAGAADGAAGPPADGAGAAESTAAVSELLHVAPG